MDFNAFTQKSQQAILSARDLATQRTQPYVEPEHLLAGLLAQTDGLIYPILAKLDIHTTEITGPVERSLAAIPTVVGSALETVDDLGEEWVVEIVEHDPDRAGPTARQIARQHVRPVSELVGRLENEGTSVVAHVGFATHDQRDERDGNTGSLGDLLHRCVRHLPPRSIRAGNRHTGSGRYDVLDSDTDPRHDWSAPSIRALKW